ncbi:pre-mRNA-splicing factor prp46 [Coemansia javaensis]|uniref:Pre-mRNA-splicing factor prp46 n=1 Tax=Coemansia javaensis TaxID=2761396 RepID=A0A9W8LEY0_9FUNG|nr:pre-mRNA-splicing factor prp46 [Coemansia javaensis]
MDGVEQLRPAVDATAEARRRLFRGAAVAASDPAAADAGRRLRVAAKYRAEYLASRELPRGVERPGSDAPTVAIQEQRRLTWAGAAAAAASGARVDDEVQAVLDGLAGRQQRARARKPRAATRDVVLAAAAKAGEAAAGLAAPAGQQVARRRNYEPERPAWHAPWKLMRVISGHIGWVRALAVEPGNRWFASGSVDRTIKIWDLASGTLRLTLTGHISPVRGLAVSARHPYLFSCGEDKQVKCWDLETNRVVRQYHGHLSGVYSLALHPVLDVLVTGGRDSVARVWDMRTKQQVHVLTGHRSTVSAVQCQEADPQVVTGSMDTTVRLWDLAAGKAMATLTHHKKSVRALALHPTEFGFASAGADAIKQWRCPRGDFVQNLDGHAAIVNALSVSADGVVFSGGDDGSMRLWDWRSGHCFQEAATVAQPGSLDSEAGVFCSTFDRSGFRLLTGEADKTIKIWKEDEAATEATHPIDFRPELARRRY